VESSPHPVVSIGIQETIEDVGSPAITVGSLRRNDGDLDRLLTSLAELHVHGVTPDWPKVFPPGAHRVDLPTYAFQHQHYWPSTSSVRAAGDPSDLGLTPTHHPLLAAAVVLASGDGSVLTGRLSLDTHPWLADHVVGGQVVVPGTALLELAVLAGDHVGARSVEELTLHAPMLLPETVERQVQVTVAPFDESGRCAVTVHSRAVGNDQAPWTRHASGILTAAAPAAPAADTEAWPPAGAEAVDVAGLYASLDNRGLAYGPAFRGLRRAWRMGDEVLAEVDLDLAYADATSASYNVHPALLDSALHSLAAGDTDGTAALPFSWRDVTAFSSGATALRIRITGLAGEEIALRAYDFQGVPVVTVAGLALRPVPEGGIAPEEFDLADALFQVEWTPLPPSQQDGDADVAVVECGGWEGEGAERVHAAARETLELLTDWLADERCEASCLVVVTRGAHGGGDLAADAVWGLVRSAQSEHPGRFVLVDADAGADAGVGGG
ncbi:polyketide synthase dehydratase domain-containing protein, partial [Streptomyces sp. NPDC048612]|uniref:polyketide synthase dehydratase domain-containing protein n=1 Tax=Streptomyces sp. NPDC048612 TaxID=3365579 RepID=UPI0037111FBF